jgi:hypothetical protein
MRVEFVWGTKSNMKMIFSLPLAAENHAQVNRSFLMSELEAGLPDLSNKNTRCLVTIEFQMNNK